MNRKNNTHFILFVSALVLITIFSAFLRIQSIDRHDLSFDESITVAIVASSPAEVFRGELSPKTPPLYPVMLKGWSVVFGHSEKSLRGLSCFFGVLLVFIVGFVGHGFFSPGAGLVAALMVAISPLQIFYSQQARCYSLLAVAVLAYLYFSIKCLESGGKARFAGMVISGLAVVYVHACGIFVIPVPLVMCVVSPNREKASIAAGAVFAILLGASFFWWHILADSPGRLNPWVQNLWDSIGVYKAPWRSVSIFSGAGKYPEYLSWRFHLESVVRVPWTIPVLFFGIIIFPGFSRFIKEDDRAARAFEGATLFTAVPLVLMALLAHHWTPVYIVGRTDIIAAPAFFLVVGAAVSRLRKPAAAMVLIVIIIFSVGDLTYYYSRKPDRDWSTMASIVENISGGASIPVVCTEKTCDGIRYYLRKKGDFREVINYPSSGTMVKGAFYPPFLMENTELLKRDAESAMAELLEDTTPDGNAILMFYSRDFSDVNSYLFNEIDDKFEILQKIGTPPSIKFLLLQKN